jgi:hypothetical protein
VKKNREQPPVTGELDQEKSLRDCDECRDAKRNWQVPEQTRVEGALHLPERAKKYRNAKQPRGRGNSCGKPWQMDDAATRSRKRFGIDHRSAPQPIEYGPQRKNALQPQPNPNRINNAIVNDDSQEKAMRESSCRQQRTDNSHIVPNVKRASEQLRNDGRERD